MIITFNPRFDAIDFEGCFWIRTRTEIGDGLAVEIARRASRRIDPERFDAYTPEHPRRARDALLGHFPNREYTLQIFRPDLLDAYTYEYMTIDKYIVDGDPGIAGISCLANWKMLPYEVVKENRRRAWAARGGD